MTDLDVQLKKLILFQNGDLEPHWDGSGVADESGQRIKRVFDLAGSSEEAVSEALCEAARLGAHPISVAAMCDELRISQAQSRRVMACMGLQLAFNLGGDRRWTVLSSEPMTGATPTGHGRTIAEAFQAFEAKPKNE